MSTLLIVASMCAVFGILLYTHPPTLLALSLGTMAVASWASFAAGDVNGGVMFAALGLLYGWLAFFICRLTRVPQPYRAGDEHVAADAHDTRSDTR